jgi:hypothetical protein
MSHSNTSQFQRHSQGGFALVIALGLMAFVLLLLLSITTLVRVETQGAAMQMQRLQAEQNAYLGLQLAIGELQKHAGVDQRITARSDLIADTSGAPTAALSRKYYTGVWDSQTGTFRKWLASVTDASGQSDPSGLVNELDVNNAATGTTTIALMKVPGNAAEDVLVDQVQVDDTGAYAFWIADEGVKAKVDLVDSEAYYDAIQAGDAKELILRAPLGAAPSVGAELLTGLSSIMMPKKSDSAFRENLRKITQNDEFEILGATQSALGALQHDVTTFSYGLLTNPKDGGLKEDLSLAFEHGNKDSGNVFTVENYAHPSGKAIDVRGPSWALFQDHYNLYKQMSYANGAPQLDTNDPVAHGLLSGSDQDNFYSHRDSNKKVYMDVTVFPDAEPGGSIQSPPPGDFELPRPVRVQRQPIFLGSMVVISMYNDAGKLVTILNPVALMWNPYNTALRLHEAATITVPMKFGIEYLFNDPADPNPYKGRLSTSVTAPRNAISLGISDGETFEPGEIKLYTVGDERTTSRTPSVVNEINYSNGYYIEKWLKAGEYWRVLQQQINKSSYYTTAGLDMPSPEATVQIAVTPIQTNWHDSSYAPASISGGVGRYYQLSFMITSGMRSLDDAGLDISQGSFSAYSSTGKEGRIFIGADVPVANLSNPTPVGIYFFASNAADSVNNQLPTATALEMHLSSNQRALFSSSLHGTYQHLRNNPSTIYEPQDFIGTSTLNGLFFDDRYAHYGMSYNNAGNGQNRPVAWEFPTAPLTSLAQLQHVYFNTDYYEPSYAVGNSFASPYVRRNETISSVGPMHLASDYPQWIGSAIDFSYLLNESLWDGYFLSSLAPTYEDGALKKVDGQEQDLNATIDTFVTRSNMLKNSRMQLHLPEGADAATLGSELKDPTKNPEEMLAGHLMVEGAFNVNSVSVEAWKAFLGSLYAQDVVALELGDSADGGGADLELSANADQAVVSRFSLPTLDRSHPNASSIQNNSGSGYRTLDADELQGLALEIVKQVRARGPFLSLSEFVNRTLVASSAATGLMGPLQQAINDAALNDDYALGLTVNKGGASPSANTHDVFLEPEAGTGNSYGAGPGYLLQGDLLNALGPFISVKSNTFMVRSYGESVNPVTGRQSSVYLEAIVQQVPEFVDTTNPVDTAIDDLNPENKSFGRQFNIVQVRRLTGDEI